MSTYNSPLRIISHIATTCPCRQTARKMPETENCANIFFLASGPAFFHLSTQMGKSDGSGDTSDCVTRSSQSLSLACLADQSRLVPVSFMNLSTSIGLIHRGDNDCRKSARGFPARKSESTNLSELFPSMATIIEYFNGGSSFVLYMHGGHAAVFSVVKGDLLSARSTRSSTAEIISK